MRLVKRFGGYGALAGLMFAAIPAAAAGDPAMAATARNRKTITAFADLFYRQKKVRAAFDRYVAPGYVQHNPNFTDGPESAINGLEKIFGPEAKLEVKRIIVDGDYAAVHIFGRLNTGDRGLAVVDIYRLSHGKLVEHWDVVQPIPEKPVNPHAMF